MSVGGTLFTLIPWVHFRACTLLLLLENKSWIGTSTFSSLCSQSVSTLVKNVYFCNLCIKCSQNYISLLWEFSVHIFSFILINKTVWKNNYHLCTFRKVAAENKELEVVTACAEIVVLYKNIQREYIFLGHLASVKDFQPKQEVYHSKLSGCFSEVWNEFSTKWTAIFQNACLLIHLNGRRERAPTFWRHTLTWLVWWHSKQLFLTDTSNISTTTFQHFASCAFNSFSDFHLTSQPLAPLPET